MTCGTPIRHQSAGSGMRWRRCCSRRWLRGPPHLSPPLWARSHRWPRRDPGRIAIIDASKNTRAYLDALAAAGVRVIGRYYARCAQPGLEEKRLIGNPGEIDAILSHPARFGVLSIYQFYNNSPLKFSGQRETTCKLPNGQTRKIRVTLADETCTGARDRQGLQRGGGTATDAGHGSAMGRRGRRPAGAAGPPAAGHRHLLRRRLQRRRRHRAVAHCSTSRSSARY